MAARRRRLIYALLAAVCALAILAAVAVHILRSPSFANRVRVRIVSVLARATGGRVELQSFRFHWRSLTADLGGLVVHGTEAEGSEPLLSARQIEVQIKIVSLMKREFDVTSIVADFPEVHLIIRPDGTTNLPILRHTDRTFSDQLLDLRVHRFELRHGELQVNVQRIPLNIRGEELKAALAYDPAQLAYNISLSSESTRLDCCQSGRLAFRVGLEGQLTRYQLTFRRANLESGAFGIEAKGGFTDLAQVSADFTFTGHATATQIPALSREQGLDGDFTGSGSGHYDAVRKLSLKGRLQGRSVAYRSAVFRVQRSGVVSDFEADANELDFRNVQFAGLGGTFSGSASVKSYRALEIVGLARNINLRDTATALKLQRLPYDASATGEIQLRMQLPPRVSSTFFDGDLKLEPVKSDVPVSGRLQLAYDRGAIRFENSQVQLPSTQVGFAGTVNESLKITVDSGNVQELQPALEWVTGKEMLQIPLKKGEGVHFDGDVSGNVSNPSVAGNLALDRIEVGKAVVQRFRSHIAASQSSLAFSGLDIAAPGLKASGEGSVKLVDWTTQANSRIRIKGQVAQLDLDKWSAALPQWSGPRLSGIANGSFDLGGTVAAPSGSAHVTVARADAYGQQLNIITADASLAGGKVEIRDGRLQAGPAIIFFSASYTHKPSSWREGQITAKIDSNGFPLSSLTVVRNFNPRLRGDLQIHVQGAADISNGDLQPVNTSGTVEVMRIAEGDTALGNLLIQAKTEGKLISAAILGKMQSSPITGSVKVQLTSGAPFTSDIHFGDMSLGLLAPVVSGHSASQGTVDGRVRGELVISGRLQNPDEWEISSHLEHLELASSLPAVGDHKTGTELILQNAEPIRIEAARGIASVERFQLTGKDTNLAVSGSFGYLKGRSLDLKVNGEIDLTIFRLLDPNVQSSGQSVIAATVGGKLEQPQVKGTLELRNGSFFLPNIPNGLSAVNGTVLFSNNRATVQRMTAQSGGGAITLSGSVNFGTGPVVYHLNGLAENVRVRYAGSVSVTATADLQLTGTSESSLLAGTATISRVVFNPNADVGTVLASLAAPSPTPANEKDFLTGLRLDIAIDSAPNLQLSTALSQDVEAEIDLRLRGSPLHPILLGDISANQGDIRVFGTRYTINRGEIDFQNTLKIEPVLDLDLQTETRGITVGITIAGTLNKLNITYRSDPPLQPRDIIALLTVGRTPNTASNIQNVQVANDTSALQSGANTVLGQAFSPVSNRLQKLFGITNIKIDPLVQGITNTPQARLTVEEQISTTLTVTYVTNLSQTSEQIFRVEWAWSRQYSLIVLRDENGEFGFDIQYKKQFK